MRRRDEPPAQQPDPSKDGGEDEIDLAQEQRLVGVESPDKHLDPSTVRRRELRDHALYQRLVEVHHCHQFLGTLIERPQEDDQRSDE